MISSENGLLLATVLLKRPGRDIGGFVDEARQGVAAVSPSLPATSSAGADATKPGSARERLQVVVPIALLVIFARSA